MEETDTLSNIGVNRHTTTSGSQGRGGAVISAAVAAPRIPAAYRRAADGQLISSYSSPAPAFARVGAWQPHPVDLVAPPGPHNPLLLIAVPAPIEHPAAAAPCGRGRSLVAGSAPPARRTGNEPDGKQISKQGLTFLKRAADGESQLLGGCRCGGEVGVEAASGMAQPGCGEDVVVLIGQPAAQFVLPKAVISLDRRRGAFPRSAETPSFFASLAGTRMLYVSVHATFEKLLAQAGVGNASADVPRLHDLRHSFAVATLITLYRNSDDVQAHLPWLSTYLGHSEPRYTYGYLSAAPELLTLATQRLEKIAGHIG